MSNYLKSARDYYQSPRMQNLRSDVIGALNTDPQGLLPSVKDYLYGTKKRSLASQTKNYLNARDIGLAKRGMWKSGAYGKIRGDVRNAITKDLAQSGQETELLSAREKEADRARATENALALAGADVQRFSALSGAYPKQAELSNMLSGARTSATLSGMEENYREDERRRQEKDQSKMGLVNIGTSIGTGIGDILGAKSQEKQISKVLSGTSQGQLRDQLVDQYGKNVVDSTIELGKVRAALIDDIGDAKMAGQAEKAAELQGKLQTIDSFAKSSMPLALLGGPGIIITSALNIGASLYGWERSKTAARNRAKERRQLYREKYHALADLAAQQRRTANRLEHELGAVRSMRQNFVSPLYRGAEKNINYYRTTPGMEIKQMAADTGAHLTNFTNEQKRLLDEDFAARRQSGSEEERSIANTLDSGKIENMWHVTQVLEKENANMVKQLRQTGTVAGMTLANLKWQDVQQAIRDAQAVARLRALAEATQARAVEAAKQAGAVEIPKPARPFEVVKKYGYPQLAEASLLKKIHHFHL